MEGAYLQWLATTSPAGETAAIQSSSTKSSAGLTRRRLEPEAYDILDDYFRNVTHWPDSTAQEELAEQVRAVPGCEYYTARQVYSYFANTRAKVRASGGDVPKKRPGRRKACPVDQNGESPLQTPLQSDPGSVLAKLNILLGDDPDPSPEVAEIWAESLGRGVAPDHILTYAFLRRAESQTLESPVAEPDKVQPQPSAPSLRPSPVGPSPAKPPLEPDPEPSTSCAELASPPFPRYTPTRAVKGPTTAAMALTTSTDKAPDVDILAASEPRSPPSSVPEEKETITTDRTQPIATSTAPEESFAERVRAALLEATSTQRPGDTRESPPKTFLDFSRWLREHNEQNMGFAEAFETMNA